MITEHRTDAVEQEPAADHARRRRCGRTEKRPARTKGRAHARCQTGAPRIERRLRGVKIVLVIAPMVLRANNGRSQCALRRTGMNDTMCQNQSQYCPFCGSFAKSPPSWQKKQGTPLRSNCFIRCRVKLMLLVLQSQGMGTIFSKPSR